MNKPALRLIAPTDRPLYEIDKHIPIPPRYARDQYPWAQMKVGDSFFVEGDAKAIDAAKSAARYRARKAGEKCTMRKKANGVRIWRTK